MCKINRFLGIPVLFFHVILLMWLLPAGNDLILAFGPLAALGIGAATGFLGGVFGESEEEARNRKRKEAIGRLNNMIKTNLLEGQTKKTQADRQFGSATVDRRRSINDELYEQGLDPGTSIASNERDLVQGNIGEKENIEDNVSSMNKNLQNQISGLESDMEDAPGWLEQGLSGGIKGGALGLNVQSAVSNIVPSQNPQGTMNSGMNNTTSGTLPNSMNISNDQVNKFNNVMNPFMSGEKSTFETGNLLNLGDGTGEGDLLSQYLKKYPYLKNKLSLSSNYIQ